LRSLEFGELRIPIASVKQGIADFDFKTSRPELNVGAGAEEPTETRVNAHVTPLGTDYLVELQVERDAAFECDRCGERFFRRIQGQVKTLYQSPRAGIPSEESDEVRLLPADAHFIDVFQDAVDALLLAVPIKLVCRESCKGLCARCGKNLNEGACVCKDEPPDSRWDALKAIRFDE
jgi:uncharacterized protein